MPYTRTQVLLQPEQHEALRRLAEREGRSLSALVREAVDLLLESQGSDPERQRSLAALERLRDHRAAILERRGGQPLTFDVVEAIREAREERDDALFGPRAGRRG